MKLDEDNKKPMKPKVPRKPLHLVKNHQKSASFSSACKNESVNSIELKKQQRKTCIDLDRSNPTKFDDRRRRSSNAIMTTYSDEVVASISKISAPQPQEPVLIDNEDGDYVMINFPSVEPGTVIRTDIASGKLEVISKTPADRTDEKRTTIRSASDTSLSQKNPNSELDSVRHHSEELFQNLRLQSLSSLPPHTTSESTTDECGYEIPLAFQTPTYMSLDEIETLPTKTVFDSQRRTAISKLSRNKKVRLARYKRKAFKQSSTSSEEKEYSLESNPNLSGDSHGEDEISDEIDVEKVILSPINSFLSERLKTCGSNCLKNHDHKNIRLRYSLGSSGMTYSSSESDNDFSDVDSDSHYQQIDFPDPTTCDHAYERIYEIFGSKQSRGHSVRKHPCEYMEIEPCSPNNSPFPCEINPEQQGLKKFSEMRCNCVTDCTWNTVSTPGVLKLSDYKLRASNDYTSPFTQANKKHS